MEFIAVLLAIAVTASVTLTPMLTRYPGLFKGKLSVLGFNAEITVDGRSGAEKDE